MASSAVPPEYEHLTLRELVALYLADPTSPELRGMIRWVKLGLQAEEQIRRERAVREHTSQLVPVEVVRETVIAYFDALRDALNAAADRIALVVASAQQEGASNSEVERRIREVIRSQIRVVSDATARALRNECAERSSLEP